MSQSTLQIQQNGTKYWHNEDYKFHRLEGPAVEYSSGTLEWWVNGQLHRDDGPAVEISDGTKYWYRNGRRHRTDGPAVVYQENYEIWYINGDYLGSGRQGFWRLWDRLDEEQRQNVNLHTWLIKLTNS